MDPRNLKATFRKAVGLRNVGDFEGAKAELKRGLLIDPDSKDLKKEMATLKQVLSDEKKKARKAFGGAFNKGTGSLYEDKEEEKVRKQMKKREEERKEKARKEREEKENKQKWEDECVKRMTRSEPPVSYDDWCMERKKEEEMKEKAKKEEEERKKKQKRDKEEERKKKQRAEREKYKKDNMELSSDEEDLGLKKEQIRGYKLNSEGKVRCSCLFRMYAYFSLFSVSLSLSLSLPPHLLH